MGILKKLKGILLKSYFLALILSFVIIIFLPDMFDRYEIRVVDSGLTSSGNDLRIYHSDIDNDKYSEQIRSFNNSYNKAAIQIVKSDGGMIDQWNYDGSIPGTGERLAFGDYDNDSIEEIYVFHRIADTVVLSCIEPLDTIDPFEFKNKKICVLTRQFAEPDFYLHNIRMKDINGDKKKELVFLITSGSSKFPRNIIVCDFFNDTVLTSPIYGSNLQNFTFSDMNRDGKLEIVGDNKAAGNVPDSLGFDYPDYSAWVMAYDHNLKLLFEPIEYPGFRSSVDVVPVNIDGKQLLAVFYYHRGSKDNFPQLLLINYKGNTIKKYLFPKSNKIVRKLFVPDEKNTMDLMIFDENGKVNIFDKGLKLKKIIEFEQKITPPLTKIDLNNDKKKEMIMQSETNDLIITTEFFKDPVIFPLKNSFSFGSMSVIKNGDARPSLFFYNIDNYLELQYFRNPLSSLRFLIYAGIYLSVWFLILLIRKLQLIQIRKKDQIRNQIIELQLKSFKNQINPHFVFNVFNTIASLIRKESKTAYQPFIQFSNLIRNTLESSDKITRSIEDELNYLENFLELEKLRFPDKLTYSIKISENVDTELKIPKMILQTYVENAIKHGIKHKDGKGSVEANICKTKDFIKIEITDDGVGRKKAKELSADSTGFGLKIMDNYFKLFNEYNELKIRHEIVDLYEKNNIPSGTKVEILIPLNFSYKLRKHEK